MTKNKPTRMDQVLSHFARGKSLTQGEAIILGYGTRLAATINVLRARGHDIKTVMKEDLNGNPYAEYQLVTRNSRSGNIRRAA
jgi:hypothetical protein